MIQPSANRLPALGPVLLPVLALLCVAILVFALNPTQPLVESHSYRQTQTAITSFWMLHGGDFLHYLTPILGYPWTMPMELPLFQALVAQVSAATGWPLDFTGRLVSFVFFLLTCIPVAICLRRYGWPAAAAALTIFLTSPVNLFYARAFLMETAATLAALLMLCSYIGFRRTGRVAFLTSLVVFGALAGLQKVTTFLPVLAVCCLDAAIVNFAVLRDRRWREIEWPVALALLLSLVLPAWWTIHADQVKSGGALSSLLTSGHLSEWNFGTLAQRLRAEQWLRIFYDRLFLYGGLSIAAVVVVFAAVRRQALFNREVFLFAGSGVLGPLVFWNLYFVHDYYQLASVVFFACAAAISVSPLLNGIRAASAVQFVGVMTLMLSANLWLFQQRYWHLLFLGPGSSTNAYVMGRYLKDWQSPEDVSVIFGLRFSSTVPYYAERYAVMMPETPVPPAELRAAVVRDPRAFTGGRQIGSVVYCMLSGKSLRHQRLEKEALFAAIDGRVETFGNCDVKIRGQDPNSPPVQAAAVEGRP